MSESVSEKVKTAVLRAVCRPYSPVERDGYVSIRAAALADQLGADECEVSQALEALVDDDVLVPGGNGHYVVMPNMAFAKAMVEKQVAPFLERMRQAEAQVQALRQQVEQQTTVRARAGSKARSKRGGATVH